MDNSNNIKSIIYNELVSKRGQINFSHYSDISFLEWVGKEISLEALKNILSDKFLLQSAVNNYTLTIPSHLIEFVSLFLNDSDEKMILDPWLTKHSVLVRKNFPNYKGYIKNEQEYELITKVLNIDSEKIIIGDGLNLFENNNVRYDYICSFPPFNLRTEIKKKRINYSEELFFESSRNLSDNGMLLFLFPLNFCYNKNFKQRLLDEGVTVNGMFFLEQGSHLPTTSIGSCLIIANKGSSKKTFAANLSNSEVNKTIYNNYQNSKEGKIIELGKYVDFQKFISLEYLIAEKKLLDISKRTGFSAISLPELVISFNTISPKSKEIEHVSNTIYIPRIGNSPVVLDPSEFKIKKHNYIRVVLKNTVDSIYLSNYLNNYPGNISLESSLTGAVIKNRTIQSLKHITLFIPAKLSDQHNFINANSKIENLLINLKDLKNNLWFSPKKILDISNEIKEFEKDNSVEKWIKSLPFPLASILWKYHSNLNKEKKIKYLFNFFEALSEFMCLIILSSLNANQAFIDQNKDKWISKELKYKRWYEKANFGGWNNLFSNLSKFLRVNLADPDKQDLIKILLGNPSKDFIDFITKKDVINILNDVCVFRNKWKGHGGDINESGINERLYLLDKSLVKMRQNIKSSFESFKLISPGKNEFDQGIHLYEVKELKGTTTPFIETQIKSIIALETSKLYFIHNDNNKPIKALPFITYNQEDKALYFYSRLEINGIRYISYHYESKPEINQQLDDEFEKIKNLLNSNDQKNSTKI